MIDKCAAFVIQQPNKLPGSRSAGGAEVGDASRRAGTNDGIFGVEQSESLPDVGHLSASVFGLSEVSSP